MLWNEGLTSVMFFVVAFATCTTGATRSWATFRTFNVIPSFEWRTLASFTISNSSTSESSTELEKANQVLSSTKCEKLLFLLPSESHLFQSQCWFKIFVSFVELGWSWVRRCDVHVHASSWLPSRENIHSHNLQRPETPDTRCRSTAMWGQSSHWKTPQGTKNP